MNTPKITDDVELLTATEIAARLKVSTRQVSERYAQKPDFPKPIRLPSAHGHGLLRWEKPDIDAWISGLKQA